MALTNPSLFLKQWKKDNADIPGATDTSYIASTSGTYKAEVKLSGCSVLTEEKILVFNPLPAAPVITLDSATGVLTTVATGNRHWYLNGVAIPGATSSQYTVAQNGIYSLTISALSCESEMSNTIVFTEVDLLYKNQKTVINIYPNPGNGEFTLEIQGNTNKSLSISVLDALGRTIWSETEKSGSTSSFEKHIQLGRVPAGIYWLKVMTDSTPVLKKVVVR
jgi:hypothetical protein